MFVFHNFSFKNINTLICIIDFKIQNFISNMTISYISNNRKQYVLIYLTFTATQNIKHVIIIIDTMIEQMVHIIVIFLGFFLKIAIKTNFSSKFQINTNPSLSTLFSVLSVINEQCSLCHFINILNYSNVVLYTSWYPRFGTDVDKI